MRFEHVDMRVQLDQRVKGSKLIFKKKDEVNDRRFYIQKERNKLIGKYI